MSASKHLSNSRRQFVLTTAKLVGLGMVVSSFQRTWAKGAELILASKNLAREFILADKLILNLKSKIVHLPTSKIFKNYPDITSKNQKTIDLAKWEGQVKTPIHFNRGKSGIILELLALQKLSVGINDKSLNAAINTIAIAFTPLYKNKKGVHLNKYNFRLHELLAQLIALNNSIPAPQKWVKFQAAIGNIGYKADQLSIMHPLPPRIKWMLAKDTFDGRVDYILKNKTKYTDRLKQRASDYKLI